VFRSLINDAKSAAVSAATEYALRISVAVPFLVAAGFGTAAVTVMLVERFGSQTAYGIMAGAFAVIGLISIIGVTRKEHDVAATDAAAEQKDTAEVATDAAAQAAVQLPLALLGTLLTTPMGPGAALGGAKALGRNWPMVLMLLLVGLLFWPVDKKQPDDAAPEDDAGDLAAVPPYAPNGMGRHAA
jgi:hypothetical protein